MFKEQKIGVLAEAVGIIIGFAIILRFEHDRITTDVINNRKEKAEELIRAGEQNGTASLDEEVGT